MRKHLLVSAAIALTLTNNTFAQQDSSQSLIWPTPEQHGTVRDLTHLPALPFWQTNPTNLQHQQWAQPGTAIIPHYGALPDLPTWRESAYPDPFAKRSPNAADEAADRLLQKWRLDERDRTAKIRRSTAEMQHQLDQMRIQELQKQIDELRAQ